MLTTTQLNVSKPLSWFFLRSQSIFNILLCYTCSTRDLAQCYNCACALTCMLIIRIIIYRPAPRVCTLVLFIWLILDVNLQASVHMHHTSINEKVQTPGTGRYIYTQLRVLLYHPSAPNYDTKVSYIWVLQVFTSGDITFEQSVTLSQVKSYNYSDID